MPRPRARPRRTTGAELTNKTLTPNGSVRQMAEWFMVSCEEAGADAKDLA